VNWKLCSEYFSYVLAMIALFASTIVFADPIGEKYDFDNDPLAKFFFRKVKPFSQNVLERYRKNRVYSSEMFPLDKDNHLIFRSRIIQAMVNSMNGPGPRHSDSIVLFVIHGKWKIVNIHRLMTRACKPLWNQVYSRLLGDRNECDERSQPDVLLEGSRRPTQTQQWDAA
jgi:hypothetical protein